MNPTKLAKIYMESFFGENTLEEMKAVLADDLKFSGPFYKYDTADEYIESLKDNNAPKLSYKIRQEMEKDNACCLIYQFREDGEDKTMAQLFETSNNKITRIRLVLNASKLLKDSRGE